MTANVLLLNNTAIILLIFLKKNKQKYVIDKVCQSIKELNWQSLNLQIHCRIVNS